MIASTLLGAALAVAAPQMLGTEGARCTGGGPQIEVAVTGLKDRKGNLKLELYPANEADWIRDDRDILAQGKPFRRVQVPTPASGAVQLCIRAPSAGRWALLFTHDRDGKNKFNVWQDGVGVSSNKKIGRAKPKYGEALVDVPAGGTTVSIRAQYLRGLPGFGPL
jgi:uncharacterized protein (DUF2141 family)